jgi:hypothetical protein
LLAHVAKINLGAGALYIEHFAVFESDRNAQIERLAQHGAGRQAADPEGVNRTGTQAKQRDQQWRNSMRFGCCVALAGRAIHASF